MKARHKDTGEIIELAEEGIISCDGRRFCWYQVELIPEPIDDFKPSLPSNLDEAAEEYVKTTSVKVWGKIDPKKDLKGYMARSNYGVGLLDGFKAGAEWQKSQMLKDAKDGYVSAIIIHNDGDEEHYAVTYPNGERPHSITDKVKIIIL